MRIPFARSPLFRGAVVALITLFCLAAAATEEASYPPVKFPDVSGWGRNVQRTMRLLATSTAEKRNTVRILFYGQSITEQKWSAMVERGFAAAISPRKPDRREPRTRRVRIANAREDGGDGLVSVPTRPADLSRLWRARQIRGHHPPHPGTHDGRDFDAKRPRYQAGGFHRGNRSGEAAARGQPLGRLHEP